MFWASLPLVMVLFYFEYNLPVPQSTHTVLQVLILPVVFGWVYFWFSQVEYNRIREDSSRQSKQPHLNVRFLNEERPRQPMHDIPDRETQLDQSHSTYDQDGTGLILPGKEIQNHVSNT